MSQPPQGPHQPQPGWYSDPGGEQVLRWWDGRGWTAQTMPMPAAPGAQPAGPAQPGPVPQAGQRSRKPWPARHKVLTGIIAAVALIIIGSIAGGVSGGNKTSPPAAAGGVTVAAGSVSAPVSSAPAPSPSSSGPAPATKVEFVVSGSAPDGIDITYGPSGTNLSGPSTLDGTVKMTVPFDGSASYYSLNAQLQGGGDITCKIVALGPGDAPLTVSHGAASGGYNICSAQATSDDGLSWQNEE